MSKRCTPEYITCSCRNIMHNIRKIQGFPIKIDAEHFCGYFFNGWLLNVKHWQSCYICVPSLLKIYDFICNLASFLKWRQQILKITICVPTKVMTKHRKGLVFGTPCKLFMWNHTESNSKLFELRLPCPYNPNACIESAIKLSYR